MMQTAPLDRLYRLLGKLQQTLGDFRQLRDCTGRDGWPQRGVYFFFEDGEVRQDGSPRVVRVGTHALTGWSRTTLWNRLMQHRGTVGGGLAGGGNHRGSVFRLHAGAALLNRDDDHSDRIRDTWGRGSNAPRPVREAEHRHEVAVSRYIGQMPLLWLSIPDPPGPDSDRGRIEAGAVALLSGLGTQPIDPPSSSWLGKWSDRQTIRHSGLWNVNHIGEDYDPGFLDAMTTYVKDSVKAGPLDA